MPEFRQAGRDTEAAKTSTVILHLEDDDATAHLFSIALRELDSGATLYRVCNVNQAKEYFDRTGRFRDAPRPNVVVLDINVPGENGFELLMTIRKHPSFARLPVVMFSSSIDSVDRARAIDLGANGYHVKSGDLFSFTAAAEAALRCSA